MDILPHSGTCINCHDHFHNLRPTIKQVVATKHFKKDAPDFDTNLVLDCKHEQFIHLHKFEETIEGNHIFRALNDHQHYVYAIDKNQRLLFLRAFANFKQYKKFLEDKKGILHLIKET